MSDNPLDLSTEETKELDKPVTARKEKKNTNAGWLELIPGEWYDTATICRITAAEYRENQKKVQVLLTTGASVDIGMSPNGRRFPTMDSAKDYAKELTRRVVESRKEASSI